MHEQDSVRAGGNATLPSFDRRAYTPDAARLWLRLFSRCTPTPGGCLVFAGATDSDGYAAIKFEGKVRQGHRLAWELTRGRLAPGLTIDHRVCQRRSCVNPEHLEPCTRSENTRRAAARRKAERAAGEAA